MSNERDDEILKELAHIIRDGVAQAVRMPKLDGPRDGSIGLMDAKMIAKKVLTTVREADAVPVDESVLSP